MKINFKDKVVIVTGAGAGIGENVAKMYAANGAKVVVNARTPEHCDRVCSEIKQAGGEALSVPGDVSLENDVKKIIDTTIAKYGQIDVLVNNAGIVVPGTVDTVKLEDFDKTLATNVRSVFMLSIAAIPYLRKTCGNIVNTASIAALKGTKNRLSYSTSKGAVVSMTRSMALELAGDNVRVNAICPGMTMTPSLEVRISTSPDPAVAEKNFLAAIPMGRFGMPDDIANTILFLSSNDCCPFTTGAVVTIDGGKSL